MTTTTISPRVDASNLDKPMHIVVFEPGAIGPTPTVGVKQVQPGFDWDDGKLLLLPQQPLTRLTAEDMAAIRTSVSVGSSWHAYQAQKKLRDRISELEAELAAARAA